MVRYCLIFLVAFTTAFSQNTGNYPSLLWKISGKGLQKPSYLYGTMHVSSKVAWHLSDEFFDALKAVDVVGLETNPATWLDNMSKTGELENLSQSRANYTDDVDFYGNIFKSQYPEKQMLAAILSYDPDIINGLLYRQNRSRENFEENTYVDLFIFQTASKLNKKVISLEDFENSEIQARLAQVPDEDEEEVPSYLSGNFDSQKIEDAYREGNLDLLDSLSKKSSSKNTQRFLIEVRNGFFVRSIDSILKTQTLFSGVGAAHLPGKNGVIEMLRKMGYTVEPVIAHRSRRGDAQREKFNQLEKSRVFSTQYVPDSLFSTELPGKLYPIFNSPALKYYVQPDMINGHFYTVVRLRHNAQLFGYTQQDVMARLDSLLFENIAGKILDKKTLKLSDDMLGMEVVSRTIAGNIQRYRIYANASELFLFKLGGKNDYALGKEGSHFFNGIKFYTQSGAVKKFEPTYGGFSVNLKGPVQYYHDNPGSVGLVEDLINRDGQQLLGVQHAVYNDFNYLEEDTFELRQLTSEVVKGFDYKLSGSFGYAPFQNFPSVRFQAKNTKGQRMDGRVIIKGVHYYLVYLVSNTTTTADYSVFDSFKITDFKMATGTASLVTDEGMKFTVQDEVGNDPASNFNARYRIAHKEAFPKLYKDTVGIKEADYDSKYYYSPSSNDYVLIEYWHHNPYDFQSKADMHKALKENVGKTTSMKRTNDVWKESKYRAEFRCLFRDTATSRVIALRIIESRGQMHQISVPYDSLHGMSAYCKNFYDSFTPIDSAGLNSMFEPHFKELLQTLKGTDSTKRETALNALSEITYDKSYSKDFIEYVSDKSFNNLNENIKSAVLARGGYIGDAAIIPLYKQLYQQYTDSFYLQLSVLKGLARLKSAEGHKAMNQLLTANPILLGDEEVLDDFFGVVKDSIELCKNLFPDVLSLCRYEEYRPAVCDMLADLGSTQALSPKERADLLLDANLALKRQAQNAAQNSDRTKTIDYTELLKYNGYHDYNVAADEYSNGVRPLLLSYVKIFAPYYGKDAGITGFYQKLWKQKDMEYLVPSTAEILKYSPKAIDSLAVVCLNNVKLMAPLVIQAKLYKVDSLLPLAKYTQQQLNRSFLVNKGIGIETGKASDKNSKDSLQFLKTVSIKNRYQEGNLYFYKRQVMGTPNWTILFVQNAKTPISPFIELIDGSYQFNQEKTEEKNTEEVTDWFSKRHHKRTGGGYK